jgi:hypothetical protein
MGWGARVAASTVVVLVAATAAAQDAGECPPGAAAPDFAKKVLAWADDLARTVSRNLPRVRTLDVSLQAVEGLRHASDQLRLCTEPALLGKPLVDAQEAEKKVRSSAEHLALVLSAEARAREEIVVPLCRSIWERDSAKAEIAHERANPGGVVDLHELHVAGEDVQNQEVTIRMLSPRYAAFRGHPFTDWKSEGACVEANEEARRQP